MITLLLQNKISQEFPILCLELLARSRWEAANAPLKPLRDLGRAPYVLYGVKYIDLVSPNLRQPVNLTSQIT